MVSLDTNLVEGHTQLPIPMWSACFFQLGPARHLEIPSDSKVHVSLRFQAAELDN